MFDFFSLWYFNGCYLVFIFGVNVTYIEKYNLNILYSQPKYVYVHSSEIIQIPVAFMLYFTTILKFAHNKLLYLSLPGATIVEFFSLCRYVQL